MDTSQTIARGGQPAWEQTFPHPKHGDLTFKVARPPRVADWLEHAVAQERLGPGLAGFNGLLAAAVAGMQTFVQVPVLEEDRVEDPDDPTHDKVTKILYDPIQDEHPEFVMLVWTTYMNWRVDVLSDESREQVKNSSGATSGPENDGSSPATTASPQAIPA